MAVINPVNGDYDLPAAGNQYPNASDGFLQDEDNALRQHLMGLTVKDDQKPVREVGVWFSHPDLEIRDQNYPYIVISLIDVTEATERVLSGYYGEFVEAHSFPVTAIPEGATLGEDGKFYVPGSEYPVEFWSRPPVPVQIDYQIRIFSRHPRHARILLADFLGSKVPYRYGVLDMGHIDGSARRLHLLDIGHAETTENNQRLFVSSFTVRVDSFMPTSDILVVQRIPVTKVIGILKGYTPPDYRNPEYIDQWVQDADQQGGNGD